MKPPLQAIRRFGFTLIEMLSVTAIISLLATVSIPAIQSIQRGDRVNKAIADLSGTLESARSYAMSHSTYVRVGLTGVPSGQNSPAPAVVVIVLASTDGSLVHRP